jgi:hypothetical protein
MPRDERLLVERWLGRVRSDDETNQRERLPAPPWSGRPRTCRFRREIVARAQEIGSRAQGITEDEVGALVDEAFAETRGRRV